MIHWFTHTLSLACVVTLLWTINGFHSHYQNACATIHETWTPASEALGNEFDTLTFMGTFASWTPYKGPPTEEVKQAWARLSHDVPFLNLTKNEILALDRSPHSVQYPDEMGGGYFGLLEATHQLHCLERVWQDHHLEHFPKAQAEKNKMPLFYEQHYEHCLDIIRQRLMCTADSGIVTFRWVKGTPNPYPDFNTRHQCRSWEKLTNFAKSRAGGYISDDYMWPNEPPKGDPAWLNEVP